MAVFLATMALFKGADGEASPFLESMDGQYFNAQVAAAYSTTAKHEYREAQLRWGSLEAQEDVAGQLGDDTATFGSYGTSSASGLYHGDAAGRAVASSSSQLPQQQEASMEQMERSYSDGPPLTFENVPDRYYGS